MAKVPRLKSASAADRKTRTRRVSEPAGKKPVRRGKGRPASSDLAVGRDGIIAKACELLTRLPAVQVTPTAVARAMHVHRTLIRYYFQDRDALILAAVERLTNLHFPALVEEEGVEEGTSPSGRLRARIAALLDLEIRFPFFSRLITEELSQSKTRAARELLERLTNRGLDAYRAILESGIEDGSFRAVDPAHVFLAVVSLCQFYVAGGTVITLALRGVASVQGREHRYRDLVFDLVLHALQPSATEGRARSGNRALAARRKLAQLVL